VQGQEHRRGLSPWKGRRKVAPGEAKRNPGDEDDGRSHPAPGMKKRKRFCSRVFPQTRADARAFIMPPPLGALAALLKPVGGESLRCDQPVGGESLRRSWSRKGFLSYGGVDK
jgi:hypothetical protein